MSWNDSDPGRPDPWKNKNNASPPDLDKLIANFINKIFKSLRVSTPGSAGGVTGSGVWGFLAMVVLIVLLAIWALAGLFIVNPAEEAVVLRFGRYVETVSPGLHWIPRLVDTKRTVDIQKIYSFPLQGDFLTKSPDMNEDGQVCMPTASPHGDGCSDQSKNLVDVELNVMYRISNPRQNLYGIVGPDETIKQFAESALSEVTGAMQLDEVLTTGRETLASGVLTRLQSALKNYQSGLDVVAVTLRKVQAPDQVRAAFNDVNRAVQDKKTAINQAEAYASKVIPEAKGAAARTLADAGAYEKRILLMAEANIARYKALLQVYQETPEVTRSRLYFDAFEQVLQKTPKILVDSDRSGGHSNVFYLPLDRLMSRQTVKATPAVLEES